MILNDIDQPKQKKKVFVVNDGNFSITHASIVGNETAAPLSLRVNTPAYYPHLDTPCIAMISRRLDTNR